MDTDSVRLARSQAVCRRRTERGLPLGSFLCLRLNSCAREAATHALEPQRFRCCKWQACRGVAYSGLPRKNQEAPCSSGDNACTHLDTMPQTFL